MIRRLFQVLRQILVSIDQLGQVFLVGPFYIVGLASRCPSADETISSYIGRGVEDKRLWARLLAPVIDTLFVLLGEDWGHCARNVESAQRGEAPKP